MKTLIEPFRIKSVEPLRMTSRSDLPLGLKLEPPLAPPIGKPVRLFLKTCSNPKNFNTLRVTAG